MDFFTFYKNEKDLFHLKNLIQSIKNHIPSHRLVIITRSNIEIPSNLLQKRIYSQTLNFNFDKKKCFSFLENKYKKNFVWIECNTIINNNKMVCLQNFKNVFFVINSNIIHNCYKIESKFLDKLDNLSHLNLNDSKLKYFKSSFLSNQNNKNKKFKILVNNTNKKITIKPKNYINYRTCFFKNEGFLINIPKNNHKLHKYYKSFPERDECEVLFRLLIKYLYDNNFIPKEKNIIDLGAWIGDNVIPWAMKISGQVYAIDPSSENIKYIKNLCELNDIKNVKLIKKVISNKIEKVFANHDIKHTSFSNKKIKNNKKKNKENELISTTLDNLEKNNFITNIGFIHLDVEGFEQKVMSGSINLIKKYLPIICWENHLETDDYIFTSNFLKDLKYKTYLINETFPHCRADCRNFFSFPLEKSNDIFPLEKSNDIVININNYFSGKRIKNRADPEKELLIEVN